MCVARSARPIRGQGPSSNAWRELATALLFLGVVLMSWARVRLGREVLAHRVGGRGVLSTAGAWFVPMLLGPPLFTRDMFSYLAQGALPLAGFVLIALFVRIG